MQKDSALDELAEAYRSGQLILYAGAEIPEAAGLPWGRKLMELLAERLRQHETGSDTLGLVENLVKANRFLEVISLAQQTLGREEFTAFIQSCLDPRDLKVPDLARAIAELAPKLRAVLTPNLDSVLERAFGGRWPSLSEATPDIVGREQFILKLHGTVEDPLTWVLLSEDYDHAMYRLASLEPTFRELLRNRPMLIIGTPSLAVETHPLKALLELVRGDNAPRFALFQEDKLSSFERTRLRELGLQAITYRHYTELYDLLRELRDEAGESSPVQAKEPAPPSASSVEQLAAPTSAAPDDTSPEPGVELPPYRFSPGLTRILDVALQIRARRKESDPELSSSAIMFAMLEAGRLRLQKGRPASTQWLFDRIKPDRYRPVLDEYLAGPLAFEPRSREQVQHDLSSVSRTPNLIKVLRVASSLAMRSSSTDTIATRHLLGALLADRQATRVSKSVERLVAMGADPAQLREGLLGYVQDNHSQDSTAAWRESLLGSPPAPLVERHPPGYSSDDTSGQDQLELRDEISGFASVIASSALVPPLSIGLFGSWGSGKSFFMKKLRTEIDDITQRAAQDKSSKPRFRRWIVPIEFNAWHYAEANLWASLVDHIFQSLSDYLLNTAKEEKQKVTALFEQLETSKQLHEEAQRELTKATDEQTNATAELTKQVEQEQKHASSLKRLLSKDLWKQITLEFLTENEKSRISEAANQLGLPALAKSPRELKAVVDQSKSVAGRTRLLASSILLRPWSHVILIAFALGLPALLALAYHVAHTDTATSIFAMGGAISAWVSTGVAWVKTQLDRTSSVLNALEDVDKKVSAQLEKQEEEHRGKLEEAERQLEQAKSKVSLAQNRLAQAEERVRAAQANVDESRPERQVARFIQERVGSDDYRKHLGVVATVRRDFQKLSKLMYPDEDQSAYAQLPPPAELPRIDRIVLYIDDLDRCPPKRVVEVLEAVHLLLAFKLFVVVVGVDSRWMLRSLNEHYPKLLVDERGVDEAEPSQASAGSHDYLEKIFQIPFWLRPMDSNGAARLISGLLAPSTEQPAPAPQPSLPASTTAAITPQVPALEAKDPAREEAPSHAAVVPAAPPETPGTTELSHTSTNIAHSPIESAAQRLDITHLELEFMQNLAPYVGQSPRRVKRFVNVYRLFKASLPSQALETFIKRGSVAGDYQPVLVLLAILTGAPRFAPELLRQLQAEDPKKLVRALADTLKNATDPERRCAAGALGLYIQAQGEHVPLRALVHWAPWVGRYSFAAVTPGASQ